MEEKVAIVSSGYFPIPAVQGGAVESLIEQIINQNEQENKIALTVYSCFNAEAEKISGAYQNTKVKYIAIPRVVQSLDKAIYWFAKNILKKKKHMSYRYIAQRLYYIDRVSKDLKSESYDRVVVENHMTLFGTIKRNGNEIKYRGKYYYHAHNVIIADYGYLDVFKNCKAIISVSNYISNEMKKTYGPEAPEEKFRVLLNRVNEKRFKNVTDEDVRSWKNKLKLDDNDRTVVFTGRLNPEKGIKELMLAFNEAKIDNCKLIIVGSYYFQNGLKSEYEEELEKISERAKDRIIFTGFVDYKEMPTLYKVADVVALPSIWNEPAGLTIIEAITAGKPLITTCSGGIPEYATPDVAEIVPYSENFVGDLTAALRKVMGDELYRERLARNAQKKSALWTEKSYYYDFLNAIDVDKLEEK